MAMLEEPANPGAVGADLVVQAVPTTARRLLEVGCGSGDLGARLKKLRPEREVFGIEQDIQLAPIAATRLDKVYSLDVAEEGPPIEPGSIDCILLANALERLDDPEKALLRLRKLLRPDGVVLCTVQNPLHHSRVKALLRSGLQFEPSDSLTRCCLEPWTCSRLTKLFLDAGFAPSIDRTVTEPADERLLAAVAPLLEYMRVDPDRAARCLNVSHYIFKGIPLPEVSSVEERPLSFVACVSNEQILESNLLASPCLVSGSPHEVILMRRCATAAEGLNEGLKKARNDMVVFLHQDVYLPRGWLARFWQQVDAVTAAFGAQGVLGVYGVRWDGKKKVKVGHIVDRDSLLQEGHRFPKAADTLDELLLALPKGTPLSFDERLGFHFYGADICLAARRRGLPVAVVDALCFHNSLTTQPGEDFYESARIFAAKWSAELPVATSCVLVTEEWLRAFPQRRHRRSPWKRASRKVERFLSKLLRRAPKP